MLKAQAQQGAGEAQAPEGRGTGLLLAAPAGGCFSALGEWDKPQHPTPRSPEVILVLR